MLVTLYKSALCPRCHLAQKYLIKTVSNNPEITLDIIDIMTAPRKTWRDGIRMIPAIRIDGKTLSSLYLSQKDIEGFIDSNR